MEQTKFCIQDEELCECLVSKHRTMTPGELLAQVRHDEEEGCPWFTSISNIVGVCNDEQFPDEIASEIMNIILRRAAANGDIGDTVDDQIAIIECYRRSEEEGIKINFITKLIEDMFDYILCTCDDLTWATLVSVDYLSKHDFSKEYTKRKLAEFMLIEHDLTYERFRSWYEGLYLQFVR